MTETMEIRKDRYRVGDRVRVAPKYQNWSNIRDYYSLRKSYKVLAVQDVPEHLQKNAGHTQWLTTAQSQSISGAYFISLESGPKKWEWDGKKWNRR